MTPTPGMVRAAVILRDGGCMAPVLDPLAGPCADRWGSPLGHKLDLEMDYIRRDHIGGRHQLERDHVALCAGHHRGSGATGGYVWATAHRELLRDYLTQLYGEAGDG